MRILHVIENLGRGGGAEQALVNVLPALRKLGPHVAAAALHAPYPLGDELETHDVTVYRLDVTQPWNLALGVRRLAAVCRDYDILHGHTFFAAMYVALTRPLAPRPVRVVTFHNLGYDSYPANTPRLRARKRFDSLLMRRGIDVHLGVSPPVARHYQEHLRLPPMEVVFNAIAVEEEALSAGVSREAILEELGFAPTDTVLALFGRFVHEKGHRFFIEAFHRLRATHPHLKAVLVAGDGPMRDEVEALLRERGLEAHVAIRRHMQHAELMKLLAAIDVLVVSSTHEGFPLVPAEGMALGKPVVATSVGGIPSLIEDGASGLLVPPADVAALAAAIERVLSDRALQTELGANGRRRIEAHFSPPAIARHLLSVYERALAGRR